MARILTPGCPCMVADAACTGSGEAENVSDPTN
jgi:hypothetical protein